tara:strand:- start:744 stop:983 length:240 start_codon:yes stop_codon:yes gene_type:complete
MNFEKFHLAVAEILDIEDSELNDNYPIDDSSVDSLARLSIAALTVEQFQVELNEDSFNKFDQYKDLINLINKKLKSKNA